MGMTMLMSFMCMDPGALDAGQRASNQASPGIPPATPPLYQEWGPAAGTDLLQQRPTSIYAPDNSG